MPDPTEYASFPGHSIFNGPGGQSLGEGDDPIAHAWKTRTAAQCDALIRRLFRAPQSANQGSVHDELRQYFSTDYLDRQPDAAGLLLAEVGAAYHTGRPLSLATVREFYRRFLPPDRVLPCVGLVRNQPHAWFAPSHVRPDVWVARRPGGASASQNLHARRLLEGQVLVGPDGKMDPLATLAEIMEELDDAVLPADEGGEAVGILDKMIARVIDVAEDRANRLRYERLKRVENRAYP